jgi:hypothetical protein
MDRLRTYCLSHNKEAAPQMRIFKFFFVGKNGSIDRSRMIECSTIEHGVDLALEEPGCHEIIEIWDREWPILSIKNPCHVVVHISDDVTQPGCRPPTIDRLLKPRTIDLYSRSPYDSYIAFWNCAVQVVPVSAFERVGFAS